MTAAGSRPLQLQVLLGIALVAVLQAMLTLLVFAWQEHRDGVSAEAKVRIAQVAAITSLLDRAAVGNNYANISDREAIRTYQSVQGLRSFHAAARSAGGNAYSLYYDADLARVVRGGYRESHVQGLRDTLAAVDARLASRSQDPKLRRIRSDVLAALDEVELTRREQPRLAAFHRDLPAGDIGYDRDEGYLRVVVETTSGRVHYVFDASRLASRLWDAALRLTLTTATLLLAALGVATVVARQIAHPLIELRDSLPEDVLGSVIDVQGRHRRDEIGALARRFEALLLRNQHLIAGLEKRNQEIRQVVQAKSALLDNVDQGLLIVDGAGVVQGEYSRAAAQVLGPIEPGDTLAALIGRLDPSAGQAAAMAWERLRVGDDARELAEMPARFASGGEHLALRVLTVTSGRYLAVVTNVTHEDANRSKSIFLASMSHELRTPLNAVLGYADILLEDLSAGHGANADDVRLIQRAGRHQLALVDQILDLSRIEFHQADYRREPVDLAAAAHEVAETLKPEVDRAGNRLRLTLGPAPLLQLDAVRVRQILLNLVGNATKFTRHGQLDVVLQVRNAMVELQVNDDGPGIPLHFHATIFEP
ncbi:MAG: HAMP domain-containing sensor histidine kinase, partial [Myxococcota bacterium]